MNKGSPRLTTNEQKLRGELRRAFLLWAVALIIGMIIVDVFKPCIAYRGHKTPPVGIAAAADYGSMNESSVTQAEIALKQICLCRPDEASQLRAMPFLNHITASDVQALYAIIRLQDQGMWQHLIESEIWQEGIEDRHTAAVTAASMFKQSYRVEEFLSGTVHEEVDRTKSGTKITILRRKTPESSETSTEMKLALDSVEALEQMMGMDLPTDEVVIAQDSRLKGHHFLRIGIGIGTTRPLLSGPEYFRYLIAHEVAHYWWLRNQRWVDEGLAVTLGNMVVKRTAEVPEGTEIKRYGGVWKQRCKIAGIKQLVLRGKTEKGEKNFLCNYRLGDLLFNDLENAMPEKEFTGSLQKLLRTAQELHSKGKQAGTKEVRQAFTEQQEIIDRHYYGTSSAG